MKRRRISVVWGLLHIILGVLSIVDGILIICTLGWWASSVNESAARTFLELDIKMRKNYDKLWGL